MSCVVHWSGITPLHHSWEFLLKDGEVSSGNHLEVKEINENKWVQRTENRPSSFVERPGEVEAGSAGLSHGTDCPV